MLKKLRVLMILDGFNLGGTETYTLSISKQLKQLGIPVFVAGFPGPLQTKFKKAGIPTFTNLYNHGDLTQWIKKNKITVIHAHMSTSGIVAAKICKKLHLPLVFTVHGTYYGRTLNLIRNINLKQTTFMSVSPAVHSWLRTQNINSTIIPNGIDEKEFQVKPIDVKRKMLKIPKGSPVLLYASRLEGKKAHVCATLIHAVTQYVIPKFPNAHLLIAGKGKQFQSLRKMTYASKHIRLLGPRLDLPHLYSLSNCVIGTGRVALEAMSCSRPVIAVGSKGMIGLITKENFNMAWRSNFGDHQSSSVYSAKKMATQIKRVLLSTHKQRLWGLQGRQLILQRFKIQRITKRLILTYRQVL